MKKFIYILLIIFLVSGLFLLTGCTNKENNADENKTVNNENLIAVKENDEESESLKDPTLEWYQLYNPNGFDTITGVISNPNNVDIDITYDLVFYKDGKEVARQEAWSNFQVSPKHNDVIWGNVDIPKASDVDEVKMENIIVEKAYEEAIDAEIKYVETIGNKAYFSVKHDKKPILDTITLFLYNDKNKNKKCDKGELVITDTKSVTEIEDKFDVYTDVVGSVYGVDFNEYEIYYNAY